MIRRQVGKEYWLITQDDHAKISGQLGGQVGNSRFSPPTSDAALLGISMHDSGWPMHDESPTLNDDHKPRDVFESTRDIALPIWHSSADRAAGQYPYSGLLVSLHGLALSVIATGQSPLAGHLWNLSDPRTRFEVNRFQHRMIEMQESIRKQLGMRIDRPLKHGLAEEPASDPLEQKLLFDFRWLAAMDQLSLAICCTKPPFSQIGPVIPRVGKAATHLEVLQSDATTIRLDSWPFDAREITVTVPFRRLPNSPFDDQTEFRAAYSKSSVEQFCVTLSPK